MAWASGTALGQPAVPRARFTAGLGTFSLALRGEFGDEGLRLRSSLEQMRRAVESWDDGITTYEAAMAADLKNAAPDAAARLHLALGAVYLDRGKVQDGIRELDAAATSDPARADIQTFRALARSQLARTPGVDQFRTAATLAPADPIRAYQYARSLMAAGRADEAVKELERFLLIPVPRSQIPDPSSPMLQMGLILDVPGVEPFFAPARYAKGFALLDRGDYAAAVAAFGEAVTGDPLAADPGVGSGAILRGASALRNGDAPGAIRELRLAAELEPGRSETHRLLGRAYLLDGDHQRALVELTRASEMNPADERVRLALADARVQSDQLDAALSQLMVTLQALPESGQAHYELGLLHQRAGRYAEALAAFDRALAFRPLLGGNSIHQTIGALHRSQQEFDQAAQAFSRRIELVANDAEAHRELGDVYLRQGRHVEALAELSIAVLLDPMSIAAHAAIAQVHLREGRYAAAVDAATRTLGLDAAHREARYVLATSLVRLGKADEGRKELEIFQRQQAEDAAARSRIFELEGQRREAAISGADGDHEKSIGLLRKVVDADPTVPGSLLDLGFALIDAGRHADAIVYLDKAVELGAHYEVHKQLAEAYTVLGRPDDSRRERELYRQLQRDDLRQKGVGR